MSANAHQDDTLIADLVRAGLDADLVSRVSTLFAMFAVLREQSVTSANKNQEGNAKARERMAKKRAAVMELAANTQKGESVCVSKTLTTKSIKKESKQALQFPMSASDEAVAFAGSAEIGWLPDRIANQWQRFRDYNLTTGKYPKNLMAAWRNWCRSPYRQTDAPKAPAAALQERKSDFRPDWEIEGITYEEWRKGALAKEVARWRKDGASEEQIQQWLKPRNGGNGHAR